MLRPHSAKARRSVRPGRGRNPKRDPFFRDLEVRSLGPNPEEEEETWLKNEEPFAIGLTKLESC